MEHKKNKKLWLRKLSCGHKRATDLAFISKIYNEPKVGDKCYCRECCEEVKIIGVEEILYDDFLEKIAENIGKEKNGK